MSRTEDGSVGAATLEVVSESSGNFFIVRVSGELDLATAPQLQHSLNGLSVSTGPTIIDLTDVSFIDSSGLNVLMQCRERLESEGRPLGLRLVVSRPAIQRVFDVTGLTEVFNVYATLDEALHAS